MDVVSVFAHPSRIPDRSLHRGAAIGVTPAMLTLQGHGPVKLVRLHDIFDMSALWHLDTP